MKTSSSAAQLPPIIRPITNFALADSSDYSLEVRP